MGGYMKPEHSPLCYRQSCPGCYHEWEEYLSNKKTEYTFHCEHGARVDAMFKTDEDAIAARPADCLYITYYPERFGRKTIWSR
jgi:hypothetical protein